MTRTSRLAWLLAAAVVGLALAGAPPASGALRTCDHRVYLPVILLPVAKPSSDRPPAPPPFCVEPPPTFVAPTPRPPPTFVAPTPRPPPTFVASTPQPPPTFVAPTLQPPPTAPPTVTIAPPRAPS